MSGATYRIETAYAPQTPNDVLPWVARITRLSDDGMLISTWGQTEDEALSLARDRIANEDTKPVGRTVYADDKGDIVPAHSAKA